MSRKRAPHLHSFFQALHGASAEPYQLRRLEYACAVGELLAGFLELLGISVGTTEALVLLASLRDEVTIALDGVSGTRQPALTRATIISRSNSEKMPSMPNMVRPAGVVVSTDCVWM